MLKEKTVMLAHLPNDGHDPLVSERLRQNLQRRGFTVLTALPESQLEDEQRVMQSLLNQRPVQVDEQRLSNPESAPWYRRFSKVKASGRR